jgi:hypothetical protein
MPVGALQPRTKTGTIDEGVLFDLGWDWVARELMRMTSTKGPDDLIFTSPATRMVHLFSAAARVLGLSDVVLYMLRHGGASEDLLAQRRTEAETMARGHWVTSSSVRRYAERAQLQKTLNQMSEPGRRYGENSHGHWQALLTHQLPAILPPGAPAKPGPPMKPLLEPLQ